MMNRIILVGRLTRDPELRRTQDDVAVCSFTLAIDDRVLKNKNGKPVTTFIRITVWNNQADNAAKFLRKGSLAGVDGRIVQHTFEKKDGTKSSVIEVVADSVTFLEPKGKREVENEEIIIDEQPEVDESKNLDSVDVVDDDITFFQKGITNYGIQKNQTTQKSVCILQK